MVTQEIPIGNPGPFQAGGQAPPIHWVTVSQQGEFNGIPGLRLQHVHLDAFQNTFLYHDFDMRLMAKFSGQCGRWGLLDFWSILNFLYQFWGSGGFPLDWCYQSNGNPPDPQNCHRKFKIDQNANGPHRPNCPLKCFQVPWLCIVQLNELTKCLQVPSIAVGRVS